MSLSHSTYIFLFTNKHQGWLQNSTALDSTLNLTIPAAVGPNALYYSIGIADLTTSQGATYSNKFSLSAAHGTPTDYEEHLNGAPFWDANNLPCSSMFCARQCANQSYPADLQTGPAQDTMRNCIFACPGVLDDHQHFSSTVTGSTSSTSATTRKSPPIASHNLHHDHYHRSDRHFDRVGSFFDLGSLFNCNSHCHRNCDENRGVRFRYQPFELQGHCIVLDWAVAVGRQHGRGNCFAAQLS